MNSTDVLQYVPIKSKLIGVVKNDVEFIPPSLPRSKTIRRKGELSKIIVQYYPGGNPDEYKRDRVDLTFKDLFESMGKTMDGWDIMCHGDNYHLYDCIPYDHHHDTTIILIRETLKGI